MINRRFFFEEVRARLFNGKLLVSQVQGMTAILDFWEEYDAWNDHRWLAYMLGTVHHETDRAMWPIEEYGKGAGHKYGIVDPETGQRYYGRGLVQISWRSNYAKLGEVLNVELVAEPSLALELDIAVRILFHGMIHGAFTGKKLADYFNATTENWVHARRIVNGNDKANIIADYARKYYGAVSSLPPTVSPPP